MSTQMACRHIMLVCQEAISETTGKWVLVYVPTRNFFGLHTINANAPRLWESFELEAWGRDSEYLERYYIH